MNCNSCSHPKHVHLAETGECFGKGGGRPGHPYKCNCMSFVACRKETQALYEIDEKALMQEAIENLKKIETLIKEIREEIDDRAEYQERTIKWTNFLRFFLNLMVIGAVLTLIIIVWTHEGG